MPAGLLSPDFEGLRFERSFLVFLSNLPPVNADGQESEDTE